MDSFMDKLAQKFTAQDMIKANSAAEEKEMKRLRMQVAEYDERLQELRKLNLKNLELADNLQVLIDQGNEKVKEICIPQQDQAGSEDTIKLLKQELDANSAKMTELAEQLTDHVHKENVKVYRNVQAAVGDEAKSMVEQLMAAQSIAQTAAQEEMEKLGKKFAGVKPLLIAALAASAINIGMWVLWILGVF